MLSDIVVPPFNSSVACHADHAQGVKDAFAGLRFLPFAATKPKGCSGVLDRISKERKTKTKTTVFSVSNH